MKKNFETVRLFSKAANIQGGVIMTLQVNSDEEKVDLLIDGDIYEEHAEFLRDMSFSYARRGMKKMEIQLKSTYYISLKGRQCLSIMRETLGRQGIQIAFKPNL